MEHMNAQNDRKPLSIRLPLKQTWKKQYYGGGGAVLMNRKLYLLNDEEPLLFGKTKLVVLELDPRTGKSLRKHIVGEVDKLKYRRIIGYQGKLYVSSVWLDMEYQKEQLLVNLWAYDPDSETIIWRFEKVIPFPYGIADEVGAWMNADNRKLFLSLMEIYQSHKLYCFDALTGKLLWNTDKPKGRGLKNTYPVIGHEKIFIGTDCSGNEEGGHVAAFDVTNGKLLWDRIYMDQDEKLKLDRSHLGMIYRDAQLYVPFVRGTGNATFAALNADNGNVIWKFRDDDNKASMFHFVPLIDENFCYVMEYADFIYKLDRKTGRLVWKYNFDRNLDGYPVFRLQSRDYVAFSSSENKRIFLVFLSKKTGKEIARYEFQTDSVHNRFISDVVADGNLLLVGLYDGTYTAFEGAP